MTSLLCMSPTLYSEKNKKLLCKTEDSHSKVNLKFKKERPGDSPGGLGLRPPTSTAGGVGSIWV